MFKPVSFSFLAFMLLAELGQSVQIQAATTDSAWNIVISESGFSAGAVLLSQRESAQKRQQSNASTNQTFLKQTSPSGKIIERGSRTAASRTGHCEKVSVDGSQPDRYLKMTPLLPQKDMGGLTRLVQPTLWFGIEGEIVSDGELLSTLRFAIEPVGKDVGAYESVPFHLDAQNSLVGLSLPQSLELGEAYIWTLKVNCMDPEMDDMPIIMTGMIERVPSDYDPNSRWHDLLTDAVQQAGEGDRAPLNSLLEAAGLDSVIPATQIQIAPAQLEIKEP